MWRSTDETWGGAARALHWTMAVLIAAQAALGWVADELERSPVRADLMTAHKSLGITLLAMLLFRLGWRLFDVRPAPPPNTPLWSDRLARGVHALVYVALFGLAFSGWLAASTTILPWKLWWLMPWPSIAAPDPDLHRLAENLHALSLWILIGLLVLHVGAALKHHFVDRDTVLTRMWSGR
jgi:cytochrome b561